MTDRERSVASHPTHVHGEFQRNGDDLVRCGLCHEIIGVLCGPECKGARLNPIDQNLAGDVCAKCGGLGFVKFPHSA